MNEAQPNAIARISNWVAPTALLLGFAYLSFGMFQQINIFDEGFIVVGAERVVHGAIPYRDFAAYYAPAQFYTLAAVFRAFGSSILVERIWGTLARFALCVFVFLLARSIGLKRTAYIPFFVMLLYLSWIGFYGYPVIPALLFAVGSILLLVRNWPRNDARWVFLAGLASGMSALYRQDAGAYACASGVLALLVPVPGEPWIPRRSITALTIRLRPALWFALGACVAVLPVLVYFLRVMTAGDLWTIFMKLPRLQLQFRYLPIPPLIPRGAYLLSSMVLVKSWFLFYVPVLIYAAALARLLLRALGRRTSAANGRQHFAEMLLILFGVMLLITTFTRVDPVHCLAPTFPAAILLVLLLQDIARHRTLVTFPIIACLVIAAVPYGVSPIFRWATALRLYPPWSGASSLPRAHLFHTPADQQEAIRFIQERVGAGDAIFVGNTQHRRMTGNDAIFYFLANRVPATRYEEFEPGIVTAATVQRGIVHELQAKHVTLVVLFSEFEAQAQQNPPSSVGASVLDDFIAREYRLADRFGRYSILKKRTREQLNNLPRRTHGLT